VTLDAVHWADPASLEVMAHLLRRFRGPLLLAFAMRHVPIGPSGALEASPRIRFGSRMDVGPLSAEEAHALLDPGSMPRTERRCWLRAAGIRSICNS
jgi:predicted ATPase